jgi:hypothetical protein
VDIRRGRTSERTRSPRRARVGGFVATIVVTVGALLATTSVASAHGPHAANASLGATAAPAPPAPAGPGGSVAWQPSGRSVLGHALLYLGSANGAQLAWMPPGLVRAQVVPGTGDPMGSPWGGQVAPDQRPFLVAGFNGGFKFGDFSGGVLAFGQQYRSELPGVASFVVYADGTVDVGAWGSEIDPSRHIAAVRQNLGMLVDGGAPTSAAGSPGAWGASVAGVATARSGVGIDGHGGLVWAGGRVSPFDLASALVAGGAVRGMQLDINPDWVNFNRYDVGSDNVAHGVPVYGATGADRYLSPNGRDFIVVLIRGTVVPGATAQVGAAALNTEFDTAVAVTKRK